MAKKQFGLIGYPLGHSFSERYFNKKFELLQIKANYKNYPLPDEKILKDFIANVTNIDGLNVTIPWKEKMLSFCKYLSHEAKEIGAVNCISINDLGELVGHNTDWIGFSQSLLAVIGGDEIKYALILGTGGSSKAVSYALKMLGVEISYASESKPEWAYSNYKGRMNRFQLIVQTTPLGMFPDLDSCPSIPYQELNESHICFDLIYNPEQTLFLRKAQMQGAKVINGLKMLEIQAEESWKIWNLPNGGLI